MQFIRMLLMCSALITLACSFPTNKQKDITTTHQNDTNLLDAKENERPLVIIMEEKDPKSDSVVVQFVYSSKGSNSIIQTTGREKDKYVIENPVQEEKDKKSNENNESKSVQVPSTNKYVIENPVQQEKDKKSNENGENKSVQISSTQKTTQRYNNDIMYDASKVQISPLRSLMPEEESLLLADWPKYFYDSFNPIKPFPELHIQKSNQMTIDKISKEQNEAYLLNNRKEKKEIPYVAGPQLNPLSIYDREFDVPIFA